MHLGGMILKRGVFSEEFSDVFDDVLGELFDGQFPSSSGQAPDPQGIVDALDIPDAPDGVPVWQLVDEFELVLPSEASPTAFDHAPVAETSAALSATVADFGPLFMGKPGGGDEPGGGPGGPGGGGGGKKGPSPYTSGDVDSGDVDNFNITMEFSGNYSSAAATNLVGYLQSAAEFLSNIITTGFTDDPAMFRSSNTRKTIEVDDLFVEIKLGNFGIDAIAAATEIYAGNDWNNNGSVDTPAGVTITFNTALLDFLDSAGTLDDVVLHEMIHALGFGLWEVMDNDRTEVVEGILTYTGASAYGTIVEEEGGDGSVGSHWAELVYDGELMTSVVEDTDTMFLADYTIASLQDLAVVDVDASNGPGYTLASDWEAQIDVLNDAATGIDLDAWATSIA